jgi:Tfp pilus assembly protein PilF
VEGASIRRGLWSAGAGVSLVWLTLGTAPGSTWPGVPEEAEASHHLDRARALIRAGDLPRAQRSLETCVALAPERADGWLALGLVHFAQNHLDHAADALRHSIDLDPAQAQAHKMLGRVQTARRQPALAERAFVEAARLDAGDSEARYLLGRLYQSEGRLVEAARFLEDAVTLDPTSVRAHAFLGTVYYGLGEASRAEESLRRAVSLNRHSGRPEAVPHLEYGIYLLRTNRLEESVIELRRRARRFRRRWSSMEPIHECTTCSVVCATSRVTASVETHT